MIDPRDLPRFQDRRLLPSLVLGALLALPPATRPAAVEVTHFSGICDASAVIPLSSRHRIVADDEDNILRIYDRAAGGRAVWSLDVSGFLGVDPRQPEVDIEAAARVGDRIYWISSHGRNRKGKLRTSRHRFFATDLRPGPAHPVLQPVGAPRTQLLADLLRDRRFASLGLAHASQLPPKSDGAISIEGLAALPDGRLLIGFRNPQPAGRALLIPLENPDEVIAGSAARFGDPILLDLEARGVRGLGTMGPDVLIVAGAHDNAPRPQLFTWRPGAPEAQPVPAKGLTEFNPEAVEALPDPGRTAWLIASDDGTVRLHGKECKKLKDANLKQFRMLELTLDPMTATLNPPRARHDAAP